MRGRLANPATRNFALTTFDDVMYVDVSQSSSVADPAVTNLAMPH